MRIKTKEQIFKTRREIEKELQNLLKEVDSDYTLEDIKEIIYNEEDQDDLVQVVSMFDCREVEEMESVLDVINDAWNYFPHQSLGGLCPMEKILERRSKE